MPPKLYRIEEVCLILALGRTKVYDEIRAGRLRPVTVGRSYRFPEDELVAYVDRAKAEAGLAAPPSVGNGVP